jgi:hypothetical protein
MIGGIDLGCGDSGAGISDNATTSRTLWPLDGGSLNVTLHDAAAYIFINIGLGVNSSDFNYTLYAKPLNETGAGNLCFPKLSLPPNMSIAEGTNASIQFATASYSGEGLYNVRIMHPQTVGQRLLTVK